ncbi:DUF998 domain-containing protein [Kribbella italica]|uniref:DUF998 domain-containing protein n=1 Tax=Kribbella italica TaxID=1540520 RepID=A0A7W9J3T5_9ACTN|nr:DUF998 domain-containing protein [Kribbella italica]MBB5834388.1 hypothetical protein [Kribbella italica]
MRPEGSLLAGRAIWLVVPPAYFGLQLAVVAAWPVPYEFLHHTVSDLGWTTCTTEQRPGGVLRSCSPRHAWFNSGGIVLYLLLALGAVLLRGLSTRPRWFVALWAVIAVFGIATSLVPGDVSIELHSLLAVPLFLATLAVLVLSAATMRGTFAGRAAAVTAVISVIGLAGLVLALGGRGPVGLMERLAAETVYLWVFTVAVVSRGRSSARSAPHPVEGRSGGSRAGLPW